MGRLLRISEAVNRSIDKTVEIRRGMSRLKGQVEEKMQNREEKPVHKYGAQLLCRYKNKEKRENDGEGSA